MYFLVSGLCIIVGGSIGWWLGLEAAFGYVIGIGVAIVLEASARRWA